MKIFKTIIALFLSILTICALYALFIIGNISSFFSVDNIEKATSNIDTVHEIEKIQNSTATAGKKAEIADIIDTAYNEAESHGISKNLVDEIFNSNEVKTFLGKAVGNTTDYIVNGNESKPVTSEDFNKLLDDNIDKWIEDSNTDISDSKKEVLVVRIKNASAGIINNLPSTETINKNLDKNTIQQINFIFSKEVKTALVILIAISMIIIFFLKKKENRWLMYTGSIALITGLLTVATSFVINDVVALLLNNYGITFMINSFSTIFSHQILITGVVSVVVALIVFITYILLKKKYKNS